jgi:glutathione S-transferase
MAIKLHRCSGTAIRGSHPCWKVQRALDEAGIDYETVKHPSFPLGRRKEHLALTSQQKLPAIEFDDGHVLSEESDALVERIRSGRLRD